MLCKTGKLDEEDEGGRVLIKAGDVEWCACVLVAGVCCLLEGLFFFFPRLLA